MYGSYPVAVDGWGGVLSHLFEWGTSPKILEEKKSKKENGVK